MVRNVILRIRSWCCWRSIGGVETGTCLVGKHRGEEVGMGGLGVVVGRGCWRCCRLVLVEAERSCSVRYLC